MEKSQKPLIKRAAAVKKPNRMLNCVIPKIQNKSKKVEAVIHETLTTPHPYNTMFHLVVTGFFYNLVSVVCQCSFRRLSQGNKNMTDARESMKSPANLQISVL